jgi:uncharacterized membrane protein
MRSELKLNHWIEFTTLFLFLCNLSIFLDIPFMKQFFGLIFLTFLPGFLLTRLLNLNKITLVERFVLSIGLSIAFIMITGALFNYLLPILGYEKPIARFPLMILFNILYLVLIVSTNNSSQNIIFNFESLSISRCEKIFLILNISLLSLDAFGIYYMNVGKDNFFLLIVYIAIMILVFLVSISNSLFPKKIYPFTIYCISLSVLLVYMLRFPHITGDDIHTEYWYYYMTYSNSHWGHLLYGVLDSILSISLLPAIFQSIINVESQELLFKGLYALICSFGPLVIFSITKMYISDVYAFLASIFFISQPHFLVTVGSPRTSLAIFFVSLLIMVLFNVQINSWKKKILVLLFLVSIVMSHYSTTYILLIIFSLAILFTYLITFYTKFSFSRTLSLTMVLLLFIFIFFWYSQITEIAFSTGIQYICTVISKLHFFFNEDTLSTTQSAQIIGKELDSKFLYINLLILWCTFILTGIGVIGTIFKFKNMVNINYFTDIHPILRKKFEVEYILMAFFLCGLLVSMIIFPYISKGYGVDRIYSLAMVILSVFFIIGCLFTSSKFNLNPNIFILAILLPYFMVTTGVLNTTFDCTRGPMTLSFDSKEVSNMYVYDSESHSASWLKNNAFNSSILAPDGYAQNRLVSQGKFSPLIVHNYDFFIHEMKNNSYIYLDYNNVINRRFIFQGTHNMSEYSDMFIRANKIYTNNFSEIYRHEESIVNGD